MMGPDILNNDWFEQQEHQDQVRMTWNLWPSSERAEISRMPLPLAALYSPLGQQSVPLRPHHQFLKCSCGAIFNVFCGIDRQTNYWTCNFCSRHSNFPALNWAFPTMATEEFEINPAVTINPSLPTVYFVLDINIPGNELRAMMNTLNQVITELPSETLVGFITIGCKVVNVHHLEGKSSSIPTSSALPGSRDLTAQQLANLLRLKEPGMIGKFIRPIGTCLDKVSQLLSTIRPILHPEKSKRRSRPTGKALSVALSLIENVATPRTRSRVLLFVDGPCTYGPGQVAGIELRETMRSHSDIRLNRAQYLDEASLFYNAIALRAHQICCSIDLFAYAQIQVGLHEMNYCPGLTGGRVYTAGSFSSPSFKLNLQAALSREIIIGDSFDVKVSNGLKVCNISMGYLLAIDTDTTIPVFFEIQPTKPQGTGYMQFITTYNNRLRVTTIARNWIEDPYLNSSSFHAWMDPTTAIVILARLAKPHKDPVSWLDGEKKKLLSISNGCQDQNITKLIQLIDHLCESPLINTFNISPDESALGKLQFFQSRVEKSLMVIQPRVWSFNPDEPILKLVDATTQQLGQSWKIEDFYYRVIVYHDSSVDKLSSELINKITETLKLHTRNPVPEVMGFKQRG